MKSIITSLLCLSVFIYCIVAASSGEKNIKSCAKYPRRYLKPENLPEAKEGQIGIACFSNGLNSVCPANAELTDEIYQQYLQGYYIEKDHYQVNQEFLCDENNYN